jgi:hypothetical protein
MIVISNEVPIANEVITWIVSRLRTAIKTKARRLHAGAFKIIRHGCIRRPSDPAITAPNLVHMMQLHDIEAFTYRPKAVGLHLGLAPLSAPPVLSR